MADYPSLLRCLCVSAFVIGGSFYLLWIIFRMDFRGRSGRE